MYAFPVRVGRKKQWTERITLPLAEGTTSRIDALLTPGEVRLDLIREGIDRELKRRERKRSAPERTGEDD
ncbi:MAG TPA: hypothetical protein VLA00_15840 [Xanthobacteraceae bacterium]|nr:hypothetical protein [Xanthobacteraceae bacterium]